MQNITYLDSTWDRELRRRVNEAFKDLPSKKGNAELYIKAGILLTLYALLYATPFFFMVPVWLMIIGAMLGGIVMAGIGMNIMHDANHGSFSSKPWRNKLFGFSMYLVGGDTPNWKMQHNVIHHSYTNVHDHDDDLDSNGILRFSPHQEWKKHHRFQKWYAYVLYSLMTLLWATSKDFTQAYRYHKEGRKGFENIKQKLFLITLAKVGYYAVWLVVPLLFWDVSSGVTVLAFLVMHLTCGFVLGIVFQPAHVSSLTMFETEAVFPNRTEHQIRTSCNYAMKSKFWTWLTGGLNFQIEHHLFPDISHVHYPRIAPIVQKYCKDYGLPYNNLGSFWQAQVNHFEFLEELGEEPKMAA